MSARHTFREYEPAVVGQSLRDGLDKASASLSEQLRPRLRQYDRSGDKVTLQNVVGSFALPNGDVAEVAPKVSVGTDWTTAVIHLLEADTRLAVTGSQRSRPSARRDDLSAALAVEFARRLERALRADGPLQVYEHRHEVSRRPRGRLDVSSWVRTLGTDPTRFPQSRDDFTVSNDFTRGFSVVAGLLSRSAPGGEVASKLRRLQAAVLPGSALPSFVDPSVGRRTLPSQWARYRPAWDIAAPLLRNRSVVGDPGHATGLEIAVEPWPLLETLLERALRRVAEQNDDLRFDPKASYPLLGMSSGSTTQSVEPDGLLRWASGGVAATFEAKYTSWSAQPKRGHVFQALSTAAALHSPIAVLLVPYEQKPVCHLVTGFSQQPHTLVTVGVPLFAYRRGTDDDANAQRLIGALRMATGRNPAYSSGIQAPALDEGEPESHFLA